MQLGLPPLYKAQSLASKHAIKYISYSPLNLFQIVIFSTNKLRFEPSTQPEVTGGQVWGMGCMHKHFDNIGAIKGQNQSTTMVCRAVIFCHHFYFDQLWGKKWEKLAKIFCLIINWNVNFDMQIAFGIKKFFCNVSLFIIEKFYFLVEISPRKGGFVIFLHDLPT